MFNRVFPSFCCLRLARCFWPFSNNSLSFSVCSGANFSIRSTSNRAVSRKWQYFRQEKKKIVVDIPCSWSAWVLFYAFLMYQFIDVKCGTGNIMIFAVGSIGIRAEFSSFLSNSKPNPWFPTYGSVCAIRKEKCNFPQAMAQKKKIMQKNITF